MAEGIRRSTVRFSQFSDEDFRRWFYPCEQRFGPTIAEITRSQEFYVHGSKAPKHSDHAPELQQKRPYPKPTRNSEVNAACTFEEKILQQLDQLHHRFDQGINRLQHRFDHIRESFAESEAKESEEEAAKCAAMVDFKGFGEELFEQEESVALPVGNSTCDHSKATSTATFADESSELTVAEGFTSKESLLVSEVQLNSCAEVDVVELQVFVKDLNEPVGREIEDAQEKTSAEIANSKSEEEANLNEAETSENFTTFSASSSTNHGCAELSLLPTPSHGAIIQEKAELKFRPIDAAKKALVLVAPGDDLGVMKPDAQWLPFYLDVVTEGCNLEVGHNGVTFYEVWRDDSLEVAKDLVFAGIRFKTAKKVPKSWVEVFTIFKGGTVNLAGYSVFLTSNQLKFNHVASKGVRQKNSQ